MIDYLETFLGLDAGTLETPFGITLCVVFLAVFGYAMVKLFIYWFEGIFGRR